MTRSVAALAGMLMLLVGFPAVAAPPAGGTFIDDDGSVHEASIEALVAAGVTSGCSEDGLRFCPDDPVSRGQMAAFLVRSLHLDPGDVTFDDVGGSVFDSDISAIASASISRGCDPPDNRRFCPDDPVSRGQMAAFLVRALGLADQPVGAFTDTSESVFADDIDRLATAGISRGCNPPDNNRFCPESLVTRAEMATFLVRATGLDTPDVPDRPITIEIVSRADWGAAEPQGPFRTHELVRLTVHHSGSPLSAVTGPEAFRGWQQYHFSLGWPDLAYHYVVGRDGLVYDARPDWAVGDTATDYDPEGHFLVVVEGDYNQQEPTSEQLESLARILAWAAVTYDIDTATLAGHRDHASTTCPGDSLHVVIADGSLRARVDRLIADGGVTAAWS